MGIQFYYTLNNSVNTSQIKAQSVTAMKCFSAVIKRKNKSSNKLRSNVSKIFYIKTRQLYQVSKVVNKSFYI